MYSIRVKKGINVKVRNFESFEDLIKRFKRKVTKSGLLKDVKLKEYYEKPSSIKRRKKMYAIKNINQNKKL